MASRGEVPSAPRSAKEKKVTMDRDLISVRMAMYLDLWEGLP